MNSKLVGIVTQYPDTEGNIIDMTGLVEATHENGGLVSVASDLLALSMIKPPGEYGADVCFGSSQRLGIPMYLGGPAAAFLQRKRRFKDKFPVESSVFLLMPMAKKLIDLLYRLENSTSEEKRQLQMFAQLRHFWRMGQQCGESIMDQKG